MRMFALAAMMLVAPAACRTRPLPEPIDVAATGDLAAPDLAAVDLAGIDLAGADFAMLTIPGCADGTREGFLDPIRFPRIAACAGAFLVPGVLSATLAPACNRTAGDTNPTGAGCDVEDLCAFGWHVCRSSAEVAADSPSGCAGAELAAGTFFITRQSSTGCLVCATGTNLSEPPCGNNTCAGGCAQTDDTSNDVFGCGTVGSTPSSVCAPLDRSGDNTCMALPPDWQCGGSPGVAEARLVIHTGPTGGALCCAD